MRVLAILEHGSTPMEGVTAHPMMEPVMERLDASIESTFEADTAAAVATLGEDVVLQERAMQAQAAEEEQHLRAEVGAFLLLSSFLLFACRMHAHGV